MGRFCFCIAVVLAAGFQTAAADQMGEAVRKAVGQVSESIVRIRTVGNSGDAGGISSQVTTGISISEDGDILSSTFGFPSTAAAVFVEDADGQRVAAKLVARDSLRQLVLLKCDDGRFVVPRLSGTRWPDVGAYTIAAGRLYPTDSPTLSVGVVSAVRRVFGMAFQTDAKISPVNYGGPLVNLDGEVMGILVPLSPRATGDGLAAGVEWYDSGIGFAISAPDMIEAAKRLRKGRDQVRGVMGINLTTRNPLSPIVQIENVLPGSPADSAGLKSADFVVEANGAKVDRIGEFNSVIKSSYAGDVLNLKVKRGDQIQETTVTLTDRLQRSESGYLGVILQSETSKFGDGIAVDAMLVPQSPAGAAMKAVRIRIAEWQGKPVRSRKQLASSLGRVVPEQMVSMGILPYRRADAKKVDDEAVREFSLTAVKRPEGLASFSDQWLEIAAQGGELSNWQQSEEDFEDAGKAWIYSPDVSKDASPGVLVLLSESATDANQILSQWADICEQRGLVLVVPRNVEKSGLTAEDRSLIVKSVAHVAKKYSVSGSRRILVSNADQASLATDLLLNAEQRIAGGAVFVESWPQTSAIPAEMLAAASLKVLLVPGKAISRQQQALYRQAVGDLRDAKAWVSVSESDSTLSRATLIGNWFLQQLTN